MHNQAITAFLNRIRSVHDTDEEDGDLYLRLRVGPSRRKAQLIHSNIDIISDTESMLEELQGYFEGWVWEEGDRFFVELMRVRKSNPLDVVAVLPEDVIEIEPEEEIEEYSEESSVRVLTEALVEMSKDANHRASISQERFLGAVESMVDASIEMAHAQAQLAVNKSEDDPAWIKAITAISPAFGPLVGDIAKKMQEKPEIKELTDGIQQDPAGSEEEKTETPPIVASPPVPNPLDARG